MKKLATVLAAVFYCALALGQSYTPQLQMQLPIYGTANWNLILNGDLKTIDTAFGQLQSAFQGTWVGTAVYTKGQMVNYANSLYISKINSNFNNTPSGSSSAWSLMLNNSFAPTYAGAWSSGTAYNAGQIVSYAGGSYISLLNANTGNTPSTSSSYWGVIATPNPNAAVTDTSSLQTFTGPLGGPSFNASTGYQIGGAAASGHFLRGNGTNYVDGTIQAGDLPSLASAYCALSGCTVTGPITLPGAPSTSSEAANKGYVDSAVAGIALPFMPLNGGAFTGPVTGTAVNQQFVAGSSAYPTIQTAVTAAGSTGSVLIPPGYSGTDVVTSNSSGVQVEDQRPYSVEPPAHRINVRIYGAKCDGTTDDTAKIQAALNATFSPNYYSGAKAVPDIEIPQGVCRITHTLTMGPYGSLDGTGNSSAILADYSSTNWGTDYDAIEATFAGAIHSQITSPKEIAHLQIIGENNSAIGNSTAIHIYNSASGGNYGNPGYMFVGFNVHDVLIDAFDTGITGEDWGYSSVNNVNIDNVRQGIWLFGSVVQVMFGNDNIAFPSTAHSTQTNPVGFHTSNNPKFSGCSASGSTCAPQGITFHDSGILGYYINLDDEGCISCWFHHNALDFATQVSVFLNGTDTSSSAGTLAAGTWIDHNEIGVQAANGGYAVEDTVPITGGVWLTDNYLTNYTGETSTNGGILIEYSGSAQLSSYHIDGNHFFRFATPISTSGNALLYSEINNNFSDWTAGSIINLAAGVYTGTEISGNTSTQSVPVLAGSGTGYILGRNRTPSDFTGSYIASGAGCTITAGAIGTSCLATLTIQNGVTLPNSTYDITGCVVRNTSGTTSVSNASSQTPTTFAVNETAMSTTDTGGGTISCTVNTQ